MQALFVGGTGFIGGHAQTEFTEHGYDVAVLSRSGGEGGEVTHYEGDRNDRETLERVHESVDPDVVVDFVGYHPEQVETACEVFADSTYVFVSSASAYRMDPIQLPAREDDPLEPCTPEQAADESMETYGARKAECDRVCFAAAEDGVDARIVRPVLVYGPGDHSERHDYWLHRVAEHDRILVPGDGASALHRVYVEDLAAAIRVVAEDGEAGEAYNAAERRTAWLDRTVDLAADALDTEVETVHASARELATVGLEPSDFPLYIQFPLVCSSAKLAALGWESTPLEEAFARTVEEHLASDRVGERFVDRPTEARLIETLRG